jgi:hypothetical protein
VRDPLREELDFGVDFTLPRFVAFVDLELEDELGLLEVRVRDEEDELDVALLLRVEELVPLLYLPEFVVLEPVRDLLLMLELLGVLVVERSRVPFKSRCRTLLLPVDEFITVDRLVFAAERTAERPAEPEFLVVLERDIVE